MEQKFKVGDLVKCIAKEERPFGIIGKVVGISNFGTHVYSVDFGKRFDGHNDGGSFQTYTIWNLYEHELELAYPSDHDLLDFAARDSKIAELTAKVSELEAELEKWKPKPESMTRELALCRYSDTELRLCIGHVGDTFHGEILARKTVTITEGEGM